MSVTKVTVNGMDMSSDVTLSGTTPTLTIGDAGAEDAAIVFDGNAQDFHIGLDDTADDLVIGLGSALGTTTHMAFTEDGEITKPLQPCMLAVAASKQTNFALDGDVTVVLGTEHFDIGSNFASNTFTAPVTGKYYIGYHIRLESVDTSATYYYINIVTSNRTYLANVIAPVFSSDPGNWDMPATIITDLDASDTVLLSIYQSGGTQQTDIAASPSTWLSICLIA